MKTLLIGVVALGCVSEARTGCITGHLGELTGTYREHFVTESGNCGNVPDFLITSGDPPNANCVTDYGPNVSDGGCKSEGSQTCIDPESDETTKTVIVLRQDDDSGDIVSGTATITVTDTFGGAICIGTYGVTLTKQ